jgi:hypothetical protein
MPSGCRQPTPPQVKQAVFMLDGPGLGIHAHGGRMVGSCTASTPFKKYPLQDFLNPDLVGTVADEVPNFIQHGSISMPMCGFLNGA